MTPAPADPRVAAVVAWFERLTPAELEHIATWYAPDASFKDPFNDVQGIPAIQAVFRHMFDALDAPRFVVHDAVGQGDQWFLTWDFLFQFKRFAGGTQCVRGATHLRFGPDGRIVLHRDYWDAAEELYEKLPALGALMRWLKRRARS